MGQDAELYFLKSMYGDGWLSEWSSSSRRAILPVAGYIRVEAKQDDGTVGSKTVIGMRARSFVGGEPKNFSWLHNISIHTGESPESFRVRMAEELVQINFIYGFSTAVGPGARPTISDRGMGFVSTTDPTKELGIYIDVENREALTGEDRRSMPYLSELRRENPYRIDNLMQLALRSIPRLDRIKRQS